MCCYDYIQRTIVYEKCIYAAHLNTHLGGSRMGGFLLICYVLSSHMSAAIMYGRNSYVSNGYLQPNRKIYVIMTIKILHSLISLPFCFLDVCLCVRDYLKQREIDTKVDTATTASTVLINLPFCGFIRFAEEIGKLAFLHFVAFIRAGGKNNEEKTILFQ